MSSVSRGGLSEFIWPSVAVVNFNLLSQTCLDQNQMLFSYAVVMDQLSNLSSVQIFLF